MLRSILSVSSLSLPAAVYAVYVVAHFSCTFALVKEFFTGFTGCSHSMQRYQVKNNSTRSILNRKISQISSNVPLYVFQIMLNIKEYFVISLRNWNFTRKLHFYEMQNLNLSSWILYIYLLINWLLIGQSCIFNIDAQEKEERKTINLRETPLLERSYNARERRIRSTVLYQYLPP